jgi:Zn-dependent peptidase ImmA (M78 family)
MKAHSATSAEKRERFTIAHEIAHYILHSSRITENGGVLKDNIFYRSWLSTIVEAEANRFAADIILMPKELLEKAYEREQKEFEDPKKLIERLADLFEVSKIAMTIRLGHRA